MSTSASFLKDIFDSEELYHKKLEAEAKVRHLLKSKSTETWLKLNVHLTQKYFFSLK